jgi:hypothetical protein
MTSQGSGDENRAWRMFINWFWRPSWDANLPDDPQARYYARKEHNRLVRRRIGFIVLLVIVVIVIVKAAR